MADWYVGTMGFGYKPWQGTFYPDRLPREKQLPYYAECFNAVEMDSTFYGTPRADSVARWREVTPPGFCICPKAPQTITHCGLSPSAEDELAKFLETMRLLGDRLGPVLLQFPPDYEVNQSSSLHAFLGQLPDDIRFAVELRHRSWLREDTAPMLREANVCWAAADYIYLPKTICRTTDLLYLRFLGRHGQFATKTHEVIDKTADLQRWQDEIEPHLGQVSAVYAFFNNDYAGYSPDTANRFKTLFGLETQLTRPLQQGRLF